MRLSQGQAVNTLRRHKYAILLMALLCVTVVESFSQRLLRPVVSDFVMMTTMVLVFLIVFEKRTDRVVALIALVMAAAAVAAHYALFGRFPELPLRAINHSASLLLIGFATFVILRNIFAQRVVAIDDVLRDRDRAVVADGDAGPTHDRGGRVAGRRSRRARTSHR